MLLSGRSLVSPQADPSASLGDEAPLSADGRERRTIEGRGINMRWFSGTVLTGLCGAGLMGGAVWAALENPTRPPAPAEILQPLTRSGSVARRLISPGAIQSGGVGWRSSAPSSAAVRAP